MSCTHKVIFALESGLSMVDFVEKGYYVKAKDGIIAGNTFGTIKIFKNYHMMTLTLLILQLLNQFSKLINNKMNK